MQKKRSINFHISEIEYFDFFMSKQYLHVQSWLSSPKELYRFKKAFNNPISLWFEFWLK